MTKEGDCAFLFGPSNEEELFYQLKKTKDCDLLAMQKKVLDQFKDRLSFEAIANDIKIIFEKIESL